MARKLASLVPGGRKGRLESGKREVPCLDSADGQKAAAAVRRGLEAWIIRANGKDAPETLRRAARLLELSER